MQPFRPKLIVVPTDFSEPAAQALRYASTLADRFGSHLLVIHADSFILPFDYAPAMSGAVAFSDGESVEEVRERLETHVQQNMSTKVPYDTRVIVESPVNAIIEQSCEVGADLIVMGTHRRTGLRRLVIGSVAEGVIRSAATPVIVVNSTSRERAGIRKVLSLVTFTAASREALRYAADLTDTQNSPLVLVHGAENQELQSTVDELVQLQNWAPRELVDRCELKMMPSRVPPQQIVQFASLTCSDLIALGVPRDRSIAEMLTGTVAEQILQQSACPVLAVNEKVARQRQPARQLELAAVLAGG